MQNQALKGIRVLECAEGVAGPYCAKLMADLGAEVIKIEKPGIGDAARQRGPFPDDLPHPEKSGLFLYVNTNKLGITLNPESAGGQKIFCDLIKDTDILIEDSAPGKMESLGLSYETLKTINSALVMTSITPFGQTGPYKDYKAYPLNTFHAGGEGFMTPAGDAYADRPPLMAGRFVGEYDAAINAATFSLGALYRQKITGQGQHLDVSKQESVMSLCRWEIARYASQEKAVLSRATQGYPVGGIMPCKDGYIVIIVWQEEEWGRFVDLMGNPEWAGEDRFSDFAHRYQNRELVNALILEWTMKHTKEEIYRSGQSKGVAVGMVCTAKDLLDSQHLKAREYFVEADHPEAGKIMYPSAGYKFSRTPWRITRPAPLLGQHNRLIYGNRLGYSSQQINKLAEEGII